MKGPSCGITVLSLLAQEECPMKNLIFALVLIAGTPMAAAQDMVLTGLVTTVDDGLPVP